MENYDDLFNQNPIDEKFRENYSSFKSSGNFDRVIYSLNFKGLYGIQTIDNPLRFLHSKSNLLKGFILTLSELNSDDIHSLTFGGDSIEKIDLWR